VVLIKYLGIHHEVEPTAVTPASIDQFIEAPHWTFAIRADSDFRFKVDRGIPVPSGIVGGAIRHAGSIRIVESATGHVQEIAEPEIAFAAPDVYTPDDGPDFNPLYLRPTGDQSPIVLELVHSMVEFLPATQALKLHYLNARISPAWAASMGRPDLGNWVIGTGEVIAAAEHVSGASTPGKPYEPNFGVGVDVSTGRLSSIQQVGHAGTFPTGTASLSMSTTSCNVGTVDVPWLAPMQEDHPVIHMAIYRLLDGRFEQIGVSEMKHGFFALSNSDCTPCQHPSGGTFLGVGCSDTYGVSNNSDRNYLAPRREINPYLGTWECTGSHFAGGQPDCVRRHGSSGHGVLDHRLVAQDADLNNAGATYYYEGYYIVRDDISRNNNWASKICTMTWNGSTWSFVTPSSNNPLVEGPVLSRFGDLRTTVAVPEDGQVMLAVKTTDLGGGVTHYEYALLNMDSDRQLRSFSLPVAGVPNITNIGFHDSDTDATNDWQVTVDQGTITWQTETYDQNPNAHALEFGLMFNFRFDAAAAPKEADATLGLFKPGTGSEVLASTTGPAQGSAAVAAASPAARVRLLAARPNPLHPSTRLQFELAGAADVKLEIYDAAGRLVRALVDRALAAGAHEATWDGRGAGNERVGSGVYYARMKAGDQIAVRPVLVVD
jgi:hypothetical protein